MPERNRRERRSQLSLYRNGKELNAWQEKQNGMSPGLTEWLDLGASRTLSRDRKACGV